MDWRLIETAPKDGTTFMVWGYYSRLAGLQVGPASAEAEWGVSTMRWTESAYDDYEDMGDGLYRKVERKSGFLVAVGGAYGGLTPTHWTDLPTGPITARNPQSILA